MTLFKLSLKNLRKSVRDYAIYFLTLVLGVAIFYVFNAIEDQTVMLEITATARELINLMLGVLSGVSVFVAFILGFLIIYILQWLLGYVLVPFVRILGIAQNGNCDNVWAFFQERQDIHRVQKPYFPVASGRTDFCKSSVYV